MSEPLFEPGDVSLTFFELENKTSQARINPSEQVQAIAIYEDITQPTMMAEFIFVDKVNLLTDFPIIGEESFSLEIKTPGLATPATYSFNSFSIDGIGISDNNKGQSYIVKAVSKEHIFNAHTNIRHSFRGTISDIIPQILTDYLHTTKPVDVDPCKGNQTTIVGFHPPLVAIDMLRKRAVHSSYPSSSFVFFENQDGFNFKCVEKLLNDGKQNIGSRVFDYSPDVTSDSESESRSFRTILEYENLARSDTNQKIQMGGLNSVVKSYDFVKRAVEKTEVKYQEKFQGFETSDAKNQDSLTTSLLNAHGGDPATTYFVPRDSSAGNNYIPDMIGQRMMYAAFLNQQTVRVLIHGDTSLKVGQVVELNLPEATGTTERRAPAKMISGNYLIKALKHVITLGIKPKHQISMDCIKMGYTV